jgi:glycyl-tRNA synthetase
MVGLDSSIIQNPKAWVASGHVGGFSDPMVDCNETKKRYRADQVEVLIVDGKGMWAFMENQPDTIAKKLKKAGVALADGDRKPLTELALSEYANIIGPDADKPGTLTEPREFNLMFETYVGAIRNEDAKAYLRPETAQGIFLNYKNVLDTTRVKVPFGIAQIGKSFRNEITPRNFFFRSREFEQMEMEWFCSPEEAPKWYEFWKDQRMKWWLSLGTQASNLIYRDHDPDELSHYSRMTVDIEYKWPFTAPKFGELEGIAHRGCFDLTQHQEHSGQKMEYFDQAAQLAAKEAGLSKEEIDAKSKYIPNVIEPAAGLTRATLLLLCEAFTPDESRPSKVYMKFKPKFAPIKAGIFPLVNKDGMPEVAQKLYMQLREKYTCQLDEKQSIGKRYARMDEAGTPYCFTIDGDTLNDQTVTVRDRDTQSQERINLDKVESFLAEKIGG